MYREDDESDRVHASGLVIRNLPGLASSWRAEQSLPDYLLAKKFVAIAEIDTRKLTRILRDKGAQCGCIMAGDEVHVETAKQAIAGFAGLKGMDLAREVTVSAAYEWREDTWRLGRGYSTAERLDKHIVAYDFGVKRNILRLLANRGCRITVVPATTAASHSAMTMPPM